MRRSKNTGATIQIGAVQFRGEVTTLPLTELSETTKDTVTDFMSDRPATGGSNMSAARWPARRCWMRILLFLRTGNI